MTIAELRRKRASLVAQMTAITAKEADLGDESLPEADVDAFEALKTSISALDARIARLEDADAAASASATSVDDDEDKSARQFVSKTSAQPRATTPHSPRQKGSAFIRFAVGMAQAKEIGRGTALENMERVDPEVASAIAKALGSNAATLGQTTVPVAFSTDWIELLRSRTVLYKVDAQRYDLSAGNLSIPRLTASAGATWGGENTAIAQTDPTFDSITLASKKVVSSVAVSRELMSRSPINIEALVRDDMLEAGARLIDVAFFTGAGSATVPTGMFTLAGRPTVANNSVDGLVATGATALDGATNYLRGMVRLMEASNSRMLRPFWTFHPNVRHYLARLRDSIGGYPYQVMMDSAQPTLFGYPVYTSTQHPTNITNVVASGTAGTRIYLADAADIALGEEAAVQVESSTEAGGAFLSHQVFLKMVNYLDIGYRHPESIIVGAANGYV